MIEQTIADCRRCLRGELKPAALKPSLKALRELGQATERHGMVVQSAVKAIATACATLTTVTNSLGFVFYSAAVSAYQQLGLEASADAYGAAALQEFRRAIAALKEVAVEDEPHPVQINWNC